MPFYDFGDIIVCLSASPDAIGYAKFRSRSDKAVIRVYDEAGNVIETHEHKGEFKQSYGSILEADAAQ